MNIKDEYNNIKNSLDIKELKLFNKKYKNNEYTVNINERISKLKNNTTLNISSSNKTSLNKNNSKTYSSFIDEYDL